MKRFFPLLLIAVLTFTACSDKNPYAGKYSGTYTFVSNNVNKAGNMRITSNPLTNGIMLYGIVPVDYLTETTYKTSSVSTELISQLLQYVGNNNNIYNAATEQIKNVSIEVIFTGNTVHVDMYYEISVLQTLQTRISIVQFVGTK